MQPAKTLQDFFEEEEIEVMCEFHYDCLEREDFLELPILETAKEYFELYKKYQTINAKEKALLAIKKALELEPTNKKLLFECVHLSCNQQNFFSKTHYEIIDPITAISYLIEQDINNPQLYITRAKLREKPSDGYGYFQHKCQLESKKNTIKDIKTAIKLGLRDSKTYELLGDNYKERNEHNKAIKAYRIATKKDCCNSILYSKLAEEYYNVGNDIDAFFNANKSLFYNNNNSDAYYIKSLIYERNNKINEAKDELENAIEYETDSSEKLWKYSNLSILLHQLKEYKEEIEVLDKLIRQEYEYEDLCIIYLKRKIRAQFLSFKWIGIIPSFFLLLKMKYEEYKTSLIDIE